MNVSPELDLALKLGLGVSAAIFTLDLVYAVLLYEKHRDLKLKPWSRY